MELLSAEDLSEVASVPVARGVVQEMGFSYIELMPIGANVDWASNGTVPIPEIRSRIEGEDGTLRPIHGPTGNGPARYYQLPSAEGTVGFIAALSDHFCRNCN